MLPKRLLRLRSKNPNESTMIVCIFLWLPASQTPKTAGVEPPGIMEFKSLHPLTLGCRGPRVPAGAEGTANRGTTVSTGTPIMGLMNAAATGTHPSQNIPSLCLEGRVYQRGHLGRGIRENWQVGANPNRQTPSTSHAPPCSSGKHSQLHNLSPGQTQWLKGWVYLGPQWTSINLRKVQGAFSTQQLGYYK